MDLYNPYRRCSKCGSNLISAAYHRPAECDIAFEHMHRYCKSCGYDWLERPLDALEKKS